MKISIIMGVYNSEKTLHRCIDSIINQSFENWEFIICDDGSTDSSLSILDKYKCMYPEKFIVFSNSENLGLTKTLNKCLKYATSEYIARMDSDDISHLNRLKMQVDFLEEHKEYALVGCAINKFDDWGIWSQQYLPEKPSPKDFLWNSPFAHPSILIRRNILVEACGYREIIKTNRCEDYDLWFRLYAKQYRGYNLESILLDYYEGRDSYLKRKYCYRINECRVRFEGYISLGLMPLGLIFAFKPLVVGLFPSKILRSLKKFNGWN